jgi:hypothetical protein
MAKILNVEPKDIHVEMEFPIKELELLRDGLQLVTIDYDGKNEKEKKAAGYIEEFYKFLDGFLTEVKKHGT